MGIIHWSDQEVEAIPRQREVKVRPEKRKVKVTSKQGGFCSYCDGKGWTDFGKCDICRGSGRISGRNK